MSNAQNLTRALKEISSPSAILDLGFGGTGRNRLLAGLPPADFDLLVPHISEVALDRGSVLQEPGQAITRVYFPHNGLISLLGMLPEGHAVDTASVGREGGIGKGHGGRLDQQPARAVPQQVDVTAILPPQHGVEPGNALPTFGHNAYLRHRSS